MLKRIYIDNYKCLVNFELQFNRLSLLLGENGSGKSTVFEVLRKLQAFIGGEAKVKEIFAFENRCRWQTSLFQTFELDIQYPENGNPEQGGELHYRLVIEHTEDGEETRVKEEYLSFQGKPLFVYEANEVQLYQDDHEPGPRYPFNWSLSGLAAISPRKDNKYLTWFKNQIGKLIVVHMIPPFMQEETSDRGDTVPTKNLENFASWYRAISQDQGLVNRLTQSLHEAIEDFDSFKFEAYGTRYLLQARFYYDDLKANLNYRFQELSDGQRMLIALYTLLEAAREGGYILCLDEPDNFVSLPEIQPWLNALRDLCDESLTQAVLISHHPEIIDLLASQACWFERSNGLTTRIYSLPKSEEGDLRVSELIARRWLDHA